MNERQSLHSLIHGDKEIYSGLDHLSYGVVMYGCEEDYSSIDKLINRMKPKRILEVGSWMDYSSIYMAKKSNAEIVCLDTWLGEKEMIGLSLEGKNRFSNGMPTAYVHFLANVKREGVQDSIIPFPQTSRNGMMFLEEKGVRFQLIYLKGSDNYDEIKSNLQLSWSLLSRGGVVFGNNYLNFSKPQVNAAINSFVHENRMRDCFSTDENNHWFIKKKGLA